MREYMMSSSDFAKYLEVPLTVYSGWETNSSRPKLEKAFEIANKLNRKVDDIWFYE